MKQRKRLEKYFIRDNKFGKLIMISAFFKNDKPSCIGFCYPLEDEAICAAIADMFEGYIKEYEKADEADRAMQISEYLEQLENHKEWVLDNPGFEICLIGNIWFLEYLGQIKGDNFNGMMATWQGLGQSRACSSDRNLFSV